MLYLQRSQRFSPVHKEVKMEIMLDDIPAEGLEISATRKDEWLNAVATEALGDAFQKKDKAELNIVLTRVNHEINLNGEIYVTFHPTCDRCLEVFLNKNKLELHLLIIPNDEYEEMDKHETESEEGISTKDIEVVPYFGDRIDLGNLIREHLILSMPMKNICDENCLGLCQKCGKNLNEGKCSCKEDKVDSRWSALAKLKEEKNE